MAHCRILLAAIVTAVLAFNVNAADSDSLMHVQAEQFLKSLPNDLHPRQTDAVMKAIDGDTTDLNRVRQSRNASRQPSPSVKITEITKTLRMYEPTGASDSLPTLLYFHGGGWTFGSLNSCARFCDALAATGKAKIVAVDYRLAPEYPFPAGLHDCHDALLYIIQNAAKLGIDPSRISVGGDSSGGNLALSLAYALSGDNCPISSVVLFYPVTKAIADGSNSWKRYGIGYGLDAELMEAFNKAYTLECDAKDQLVSPGFLSKKELCELPPTLLISAGHDILADQGKELAKKLGENVTYHIFPEAVHLFITVPGQDEAFSRAVALTADFLNNRH